MELSKELQRIVDAGHTRLGRYQLDLSPPEPTYDYVGPIKPNRFLKGLADAAQATKDAMNNVTVGFRGNHIGLGELIPGEAPRILDDAAHGFMPVEGRGMTTRLDPGVLDVVDFVGLPAGIAYGVGRAATRRAASELNRVATRAMDAPVDQGRRQVNKGLVAATVTAGVGLPVAKKVATTAAKEVVTRPSAAALLQKSIDDAFRKMVGQALRDPINTRHFPLKKWKDGVDALVGPADPTLRRTYTWKELASPSGGTPHVNAIYRQEQIDQLQKVIDGIPEGEDVQKLFENALIRLRASNAFDGSDDLADFLKLERRHIGSANMTKEQLRHIHTDSELLELLKDVPKEDIDRWILTGKRPAGVTDKMVRSMDEFHVMENSELFYGDIEYLSQAVMGDDFQYSLSLITEPEQALIDAIQEAEPLPF